MASNRRTWPNAIWRAVGAGALAGCTSAGSVAVPEPGSASLYFPQADSAVLTVIRDGSADGSACLLELVVDARAAGSLEPKGWVTVYPVAGEHVLGVRASGGAACPGSAELHLQLAADRHVRVRVLRERAGGPLRLAPSP